MHLTTGCKALLSSLAFSTCFTPILAQTYSKCNPLTQGNCPADPALGKSVNVDFTSGASSLFTSSAQTISYSSNGAAFTVSKSGDSPTLVSNFYIMFGHVDFVVQAAPGTGIVSSCILQSDDLDEIDLEWIGGDDTQVQSNYFGKGETTSYNRGAFHGAANNHDQFHKYSIDWTANQVVWSVDGTTVRTLTPATADTDQYPQTPMQVRVGTWAGGDPSEPAGTISWAGGQTDYSQGPFTMYIKSIAVTDYSTGTSYSYSGTSGTWQSIQANGGTVNSNGNANSPAASTVSGAATPLSTVPGSSAAPLAFGSGSGSSGSVSSSVATWPYGGSATASLVTTTSTSSPGGLAFGNSGSTSGTAGFVSLPSVRTCSIYLALFLALVIWL